MVAPMMGMGRLPLENLWIEGGYSLIVVLACFIIFFKTKELYELSGHKGIQFFRYSFLFFGITYLIRLLMPFTRYAIDMRPLRIGPIVLFLTVYTGTVAVLFLLFSVLWRQIKDKKVDPTPYIHMGAFIISALIVFGRYIELIVGIQATLFIIALYFSYHDYRKTKKKQTHFFFIYILLFLSWLANLAAFIRLRLAFETALGLNFLSATLFVIILWKVLKRIRKK